MKYGVHSYRFQDAFKFTEEQYIKEVVEELLELMKKHFGGRIAKLKKLDNCYYTYTKT